MNKNKDRTMDEIKTLLIVDDDEIFLSPLMLLSISAFGMEMASK